MPVCFIALCFKAVCNLTLFCFSFSKLVITRNINYLKEFVLLHTIFSRGKMEAFISIVGALAAKAAEYTVDPAARQLSYLFKPRSKFLKLHTKVRDLEEARQRVQQSVEVATRNGEVIFDDVQRFSSSWYSTNTLQSSTCLFDKKVNFLVLEELEIRGMDNLERCHAVEIVFANSQDTSSQQPLFWLDEVNFPVLEVLEIRGMDNLERLWADQLVEHSFSKLTSIDLRDCPKLMNVFPLSMLTRLQRLERLEIWGCESVEEIIYEEGGDNSSSSNGMPSLSPQFIQSFEFPNLTSLILYDLPNLKTFVLGERVYISKSTTTLFGMPLQ
ncbi:hypothetical protein V6N13_103217 [Hibiscus sabdariffa]